MKVKKKKIFMALIFTLVLMLVFYLYSLTNDIVSGMKLNYIINAYIPAYIYMFNNKDVISNSNNMDTGLVPVLLYHGVPVNPDKYNIEVSKFREHMFALKADGWQTITLEEFNSFINGEKQLPEKSFLLTFDDGRKDSYYPVDPILKAVNYTAVMYVITGESLNPEKKDSDFYLTENELHRMLKSGRWEVQPHGKNGHIFINISQNGTRGAYYANKKWFENESRMETDREYEIRVYNDLLGAKEDLEKELGIKAISFAYPFNEYGEETLSNTEISKEVILKSVSSIYELSFYQVWFKSGYLYNHAYEDKYYIKRIEPKTDWTGETLIAYLNLGKEKKLPYTTTDSGFVGWTDNSGVLTEVNETLVLKPIFGDLEGFVFLDGSYLWENYKYDIDITSFNGESFSMFSRLTSPTDYVMCTFSTDIIRVVQVIDGEQTKLAERKLNSKTDYQNTKVSMQVNDDDVDCFINGQTIIGHAINPTSSNGGIGFSLWSPEFDGELKIKEIKVTQI